MAKELVRIFAWPVFGAYSQVRGVVFFCEPDKVTLCS